MASPPNTEGQLSPTSTTTNTSTASTPSTPSSTNTPSSIKKCGYLKKQKHGHKRFFVLRARSGGLPARLEYYETEKKWRNKCAAKRVIPLDCCLNVNKRADAKHKHLIALYTRDEYLAVAAESEPEQESWHRALTELMSAGRAEDGGAASHSASSLLGFDEASYGVITPVSAAYREVWQVILKSKGLGQTRNLTGVYRLCLSSRTISFIKLNSEVASVSLQLMNIRRCGHSDSFFFIEVGRSAVTGPGELWMQADDSVVAQNIHETILEAMKAMKELSEFRPRSKSQSSGTNPISVPIRRHFNHLPPSQTGLTRRSRTDSMAASSPVNKFSSCRIRTASEGDGTKTRPVSVTGSPLSPGVHRTLLGRSNTLTARPCRTFESSSLQHSKSMSMPLSRSPPAPGGSPSPVSLSSCPETAGPPRPSSCSASFSGSPSDAGFISCEEYGSSPLTPLRGPTPEPLGGGDPQGYMLMERQSQRWVPELEKVYRKRTYSLTTPRQQRVPTQLSSASLDEYTLMRATHAAPRGPRLEDHAPHGEDAGYMPMMPGAAAASQSHAYMPMSPMCVSAPKQILQPRGHSAPSPAGPPTSSPGSASLEDRGYMRMWAGARTPGEGTGTGEYLNMSPLDPLGPLTPPDPRILSPSADPTLQHRPPLWYGTLPRVLKPADLDQYVVMSLHRHRIEEESSAGPASPEDPGPGGVSSTPGGSTSSSTPSSTSSSSSCSAPSPFREPLIQRARTARPTRLALESLRTLPCMSEHPPPSEPRSPGEYINIDFTSSSTAGGPGAPGPLSDYVNLDLGSSVPSKDRPVGPAAPGPAPLTPGETGPERETGPRGLRQATSSEDYARMSFTPPTPSPPAEGPPSPPGGPGACVQRPGLGSPPGPADAFLLGPAPALLDPDRGAKVIRADPQGRRRHSSETFSSTTTVTPVCPSFASDAKRHSSASVENVSRSARSSDASDEEYGGSPMCRETSAGYQNGLNYIALNLVEGGLAGCHLGGGACEGLLRFKAACGCKGGLNGFSGGPYASMGFKESVAAVKD